MEEAKKILQKTHGGLSVSFNPRFFLESFRHNRHHLSLFTCFRRWQPNKAVSQTIGREFL